jgi:NAD(P)H-hydrate epimerase
MEVTFKYMDGFYYEVSLIVGLVRNENLHSNPILTHRQVKEWEKDSFFDEEMEWGAMQRAGVSLARAALQDFLELKPLPAQPRILALVGKGHNGGDALLAVAEVLALHPRAKAYCLLAEAPSDFKPLAKRALAEVEGRVHFENIESLQVDALLELLDTLSSFAGFDISFDGLLGLGFKPPLSSSMTNIISAMKVYPKISLRAAVDLPSGLLEDSIGTFLPADFSYATGVIKKAHINLQLDSGRLRMLDLGFSNHAKAYESNQYFLNSSILNSLRRLRPVHVNKRNFGHLFIVGGSSNMPGALLMSVQAAVRSGVGLVTAFAPESVAASLAAQVPEAMWIPWPETSNGTLSHRAMPLLTERLRAASAVLIGPGMGRDRSTESLAQEIVNQVQLPVICDADALGRRIIEQVSKRSQNWGQVILTPHMGEFMRIANLEQPSFVDNYLKDFCRVYNVFTILKSPQTRVCDGKNIYYNSFGGAVLSRGGSGDLLAGLLGGILSQDASGAVESMSQAVVWHGLAAEYLARKRGQVAVRTTDLLEYLSPALRGE